LNIYNTLGKNKPIFSIILALIIFGTYFIYIGINYSRYSSFALIKISQIGFPNQKERFNIESPNEIISRMSLPSSYNQSIFNACDVKNNDSINKIDIKNKIKFSVNGDISYYMNLQTFGNDPIQTAECLKTVFNFFRIYEENILINRHIKHYINLNKLDNKFELSNLDQYCREKKFNKCAEINYLLNNQSEIIGGINTSRIINKNEIINLFIATFIFYILCVLISFKIFEYFSPKNLKNR